MFRVDYLFLYLLVIRDYMLFLRFIRLMFDLFWQILKLSYI